jgi:signal transduction histidine kinase
VRGTGGGPRPEASHDAIAIAMHNLRNPLNGIYMAAGELAKKVPPELSAYVDVVRKSARRLNRLVADLGELAAADGGRFRLERVPEDPAQLVASVAASFTGAAAAKHVEIRTELAPDLPRVALDELRFRQVLSDLIENALEFGNGATPITLAAAVREGMLEVRVIDRGPGIAAQDLPRVFDRFWMANRVHRHGNGLGLAVAKVLVEGHGGTLRLEATPGGGVTAVATFPLAATPPAGAS